MKKTALLGLVILLCALAAGMVAAAALPSRNTAAAAAQATATPTVVPCSNAAAFVKDVTIPDNTVLRAGRNFTKTWRVQNTSTCPWTTSYRLVWVGGVQMGGVTFARLSQPVPAGSTQDISVSLTAPSIAGTNTSRWRLTDANGGPFGSTLTVVIIVPNQGAAAQLPVSLSFMEASAPDVRCGFFAPQARESQIKVLKAWGRTTRLCVYGFPANSLAKLRLKPTRCEAMIESRR